jgi:hypothetical protein
MSRHTIHTFAVISLLSLMVTFTIGAALGANVPKSTHLSQKSTVVSSVVKKTVEPIKPTRLDILKTNKGTLKATPRTDIGSVRETETYPACISKCDYCVMVIGSDGTARQDCTAHDKCISDCFDSTR